MKGPSVVLMYVLVPSSLLYGQIDLGVELGGSAYRLRSGSNAYREGVFEPFPGPSFSAAAFYRELPEKCVGIGLEVCYTRLNFNASFRDGGIGSGTEYVSVVELDMLHVGIIPRFKIDESGWFALRTGLMAGWIAGREQGTSVSLSLPISHGSYDRAAGNRFKGDLRVVGALDIRIPWGTGCALHIDPYASLGLTSLLQTDRMKATDVGIRIGIAWTSRGRTFGKVMRDDLARRKGDEK